MLLFVAAASLAACGGFLGFGDDEEDVTPPPSLDSSTSEANVDFDAQGGSAVDAPGDLSVDAIVAGDAGIDVVDETPVDAGQGALVFATFEQNLVGGDGADLAQNMVRTKSLAINGESAVTEGGRPAILAWGFSAQASLSVIFSVHIITKPKGAGAELMRLTGSSGPVSILIGGDGTFDLRSNGVDSPGAKLDVGVTYRVGVSINKDGDGLARAGFKALGLPNLTQSAPWTAGTMDTLQIRTNDPDFAYVIDDVGVTTKTPF